MITERNMVFANPLAYRVFPNIGNSMNTGVTELAIYLGYLLVTDSTGKTLSFTGTSTIDFTGFSGYVDIDLFSDVGSVKLGRWNITSITPVEPTLPGLKTFAESTAADYVLYDKVNNKKICVEYGTDLSNYPSELYTPIGVVVVPGTHDVYGDGSCGVMSLKEMNLNSPDTGSTREQGICWGSYGDDLSLRNLNQAPVGNTEDGIPTRQADNSYLPSDKFSSTQCLHDTDVYYLNRVSPYAPSPYLTNGSRNPGYYQTTSPCSEANCLADFDGKGNSEILCGLATAQSDWRTALTITNSSDSNFFPAACCCWRYHTEGTQQGDWYLPAMGELGYIMPSYNKIKEAINNMKNYYGTSIGIALHGSGSYWSSSEYDSNSACSLIPGYGNIYGYVKSNIVYVRAFLRVADDAQEQPTEEYEYVDLGLPSGLLWAKKNIGAETEEDAGLYFQWGDTQGYTAEQVGDGEGLKAFRLADYKFSIDGSSSNFSKYNASDSKTVLDPEDDAAHINMGGNWRMPTFEEYKELCLNTDIYLVPTEGEEIQGTVQEQSGSVIINWASQAEGTLKGVKFYKKGDEQTYMVVPASGVAVEGSMPSVGQYGRLWSSSLYSSDVQNAWYFFFNALYGRVGSGSRYYGLPVRGVKSNN